MIGSITCRFLVECLWNILFKKCGISNQPVTASVMIRVFPSLEHSAGHVRIPETICRTFVCVPYWHLWTKHNRAKPMSESASALFSIADAGEFRFARFYIVCEEVPLGTPESPPIVSGVSDMPRRIVQTWKRHGIRCKHSAGRNAHIFLKRISTCISTWNHQVCF